jgi:murein L,D-transpeptidase YafK
VGEHPGALGGELQHGMRIGLRRFCMGLRMCALVAAGIAVAYAWAIGASTTRHPARLTASVTALAPAFEPAAETWTDAKAPAEASPALEDAASGESVQTTAEHEHASAKVASLPGSAIAADPSVRLADKGLAAGNPVMIRIFKAESELELWMQKDDRFELFATYSICKWSGKLGPKQHEGDRQAPEGMYAVGMPQIHRKGRWPRALNIGYPNAFDRAMDRTGSYILVHGGCSSTGCFAMTNAQMEEIYRLSEEALKQGQTHIPIHVFPFRMTETNLKAYADSRWQSFWRNLKDAYDVFERTRLPPQVSVCGKRYVVREGGSESATQGSSVGTDPFDRGDCVDTGAEVARLADVEDRVEPVTFSKARKVVSKTQRRRSAGRNARKAYAAARKIRMATHAAKMRSAARTER